MLREESSGFSRAAAGNLGFLLSYNGELKDLLLWLQASPVSMRVAKGLSGFLSSQCQVQRHPLEARLEPEVSLQG